MGAAFEVVSLAYLSFLLAKLHVAAVSARGYCAEFVIISHQILPIAILLPASSSLCKIRDLSPLVSLRVSWGFSLDLPSYWGRAIQSSMNVKHDGFILHMYLSHVSFRFLGRFIGRDGTALVPLQEMMIIYICCVKILNYLSLVCSFTVQPN